MKKSLKSIKPKAVSSNEQLVTVQEFAPGVELPVLVTPNLPGVDLVEWSKANEQWIEDKLLTNGGVLFRGFDIKTPEAFNAYIAAMNKTPMAYKEGATPRTQVSDNVYTSTEFPNELRIHLHNELSYTVTWPLKIWFCSIKAAEQGGETPICNVKKVYDRLAPEIRDKFEEKGWMLVRNYGEGFGAPWQYVFHTEDKAEVEAYCLENRIEFEWKDGDRLRTRQTRPAVTKHTKTGEKLWFNHIAFWHEASLEPDVRKMFHTEFGQDGNGFPYNTYYGDGTPIEDHVIEALHAAYDAETVAFPWIEGDLIVLDNMLVAHGRSPYEGERKTLVGMGEPVTRTEW